MLNARTVNSLTRYQWEAGNYAVEWSGCFTADARPTAILINPDSKPYNKENVCQDWSVQTFLSAKYNVIAINRPGSGLTTPRKEDFSGPMTIAAIEAAIEDAKSTQTWFQPPEGAWGFGSAAIAAIFYGKKAGNLKWLILGNGIYDLEMFLNETKDETYLATLKAAMQGQEGKDFVEYRSASWDTSGLPHSVRLYHSKHNQAVPMLQAAAFRDSLATEEFDVKLAELESANHQFTEGQH